jgi:methionine-gamma-lyase
MIKNYNKEFGFGGMMVLDMKNKVNAFKLMEKMQRNNIGYLAVSLGYSKTLFSSPSSSTSSEIPEKEKKILGISDGLVRFSVGIDNDIERTYKKIKNIINKI